MDIENNMMVVEDDYFAPGFLQMIEDHLTYLRTFDGVQVVTISNVQCQKYQGDFFGLLVDMQIEPKFHYAIMRVNDLYSAADFTGDVNQVIIPATAQIEMLKNLYQTSGSAKQLTT